MSDGKVRLIFGACREALSWAAATRRAIRSMERNISAGAQFITADRNPVACHRVSWSFGRITGYAELSTLCSRLGRCFRIADPDIPGTMTATINMAKL